MSHSESLGDFARKWRNLNFNQVCPGGANHGSAGRASGNVIRESVSFYQVADALMEGEIEGFCDRRGDTVYLADETSRNTNLFKGIYYNDTPVKNTETNLYNFRSAISEIRYGTEDQSLMPDDLGYGLTLLKAYRTLNYNMPLVGISPNITPQNVSIGGVVIQSWGGKVRAFNTNGNGDSIVTGDSKPSFTDNADFVVHTITNREVDEVVVNISFTGQRSEQKKKKKSPKPWGTGAAVMFEVGREGDQISLKNGGSVGWMFAGILGYATSAYNRTYHIPLPPAKEDRPRYIKITRLDMEFNVGDFKRSKGLNLVSISEGVAGDFKYPYTAFASHVFDASSMSGIPKRSYDVKMSKILIPSNYDAASRRYIGNWNGIFNNKKQWTDNPAWIIYDILTNDRYGLGKFDFQPEYIDKWNLYSIAKYCDELVPTGYTADHGEIKFTVSQYSDEIIIAKNQTNVGSAIVSDIFKPEEKICFLHLRDSNNNLISANYELIVKSVRSDSANYYVSFIYDFGPENVFLNFPAIKSEFLSTDTNLSAKRWLLNYVIQGRGTQEFKDRYAASATLGDATEGYLMHQVFGEKPILEPRFTANIVLTSKQEAIEIINTISALFRGISYWNEGRIFSSNDKYKDPVLMFSNANVVDGQFTYSGSAKTSRATSVVVRYNDAFDEFKPKVAYAEDYAAMRDFDYLEQEVVALGCTSKTQAQRMAEWIVLTAQTETDLLQFTAGPEGGSLLPGDVFQVSDILKNSKRYGGRITNVNYAQKTVTIDKAISENVVGQKIYLSTPRSSSTSESLSSEAKIKIDANDNSGISDSEINAQRVAQFTSFTIASVTNSTEITITEVTNEDFNLIIKGTIWMVENMDENYEIKPLLYRTVSTEEINPNQYRVTAMSYNSSKFDAIDRRYDLSSIQHSKDLEYIETDYPQPINIDSSNSTESFLSVPSTPIFYDAYLSYDTSDSDKYYSVDFETAVNNIYPLNNRSRIVGGYVVDFGQAGRRVRFCLDGYDNTSFKVFVGNQDTSKLKYSYEVYIYDKNYKLQSLGLKI